MRVLRLLVYYVLTRVRSRRFRSRKALEAWQHRKVVALVKRVRQQSPFYRSYYQGLDAHNWRSFPTIDKAVMMDHFDQLNTAGITKEEAFRIALRAERERDFSAQIGDIAVGLSSGTSGSRGLFLVSAKERAAWAGTVLAKALPASLLVRQRIAFFLRADSHLYQSVRSKRLQFRFYDMIHPVEDNVRLLSEQQPTLLVAPPSMLRLLAEAQLAGELFIAPGKVISVAEVLEPLDKQLIEQAFGVRVDQIYQCTEGFLAATCSQGTLHLNEDILVIEKEYVDEEQRIFSPIITDFSRETQPIVRYRLNDLLTEATQPCACGSSFTAIASIEGRTDDLFYGRDADTQRLVPIFPDFIRRAVIMSSERIKEYKVVQQSDRQLEVALRVDGAPEELHPELAAALSKLFTSRGCMAPLIAFVPYEADQGLRKLRRVERKWKV
ncbi:adenylate cyclase [Paenibacillus sp. BIHB 4019]|uniref:Adenylate cyclase n=1 Tax=Paenibacillus sp. BIHB 4019 TaxID=1870819 RepID=A0A1B2DRE0_9BACL|nr:F390 synthetase-related protein [Paenibacillus sp. BIHB 4019]ANY70267.1 adenylate cyclase [Paenibacillus sp. BIHB 4019]